MRGTITRHPLGTPPQHKHTLSLSFSHLLLPRERVQQQGQQLLLLLGQVFGQGGRDARGSAAERARCGRARARVGGGGGSSGSGHQFVEQGVLGGVW